LENLEAKFRVH